MNKKGFTLVELLAVMVLIVLVMLLIVPSLFSFKNKNDKKQYEAYENMMVEYTKTVPNYKKETSICLKELNLKKISDKTNCNGYVTINGIILTPYLKCLSEGNELLYQTTGYNLPSKCN